MVWRLFKLVHASSRSGCGPVQSPALGRSPSSWTCCRPSIGRPPEASSALWSSAFRILSARDDTYNRTGGLVPRGVPNGSGVEPRRESQVGQDLLQDVKQT